MGISLEQYRASIGLHNAFKIKCSQDIGVSNHENLLLIWLEFLLGSMHSDSLSIFCIFFIIFNFVFDLLYDCIKNNTFYIKQDPMVAVINSMEYHHQRNIMEQYRILFSCMVYCLLEIFSLTIFPKKCKNTPLKLVFNKKLLPNKSSFAGLMNVLSFSLFSINFILICLTIPNIMNPGPASHVNVLYHNVRGFVDLTEKTHSQLYTSKLKEFHGILFSQQPDVVILNETWLKKPILSSEIFPNNTYKVFRRDRSIKSHPPDPLSPTKFKRNGGGVIIAIRSDLDVDCSRYEISGGGVARAEILSVILKPKTGKNICISTLYRVGTLGAENLSEVNRHLRSVVKSKPNTNHIVIGDLNLSKTKWPSGLTTCHTERGFVDLFQDLNFDQLISSPTHKDGKTLDLLLTNQPNIIFDLDVHPSGMICSSDHNSIGFKINFKCKRLKQTKRKIYNLKKADFKSINSELSYVPWDFILDYNDINNSLDKFEEIFFSICDKHIPKVMVKSCFQPPWFDSDLDKLCKRKVKLLDKKKGSVDPTVKNQIDEEVRKIRTEFKKLSDQKKMDNVINDDDPALIKKKFWSFYKSTSNSTRIPETMSYGSKVRSNNKDVACLFNQYFSDQFSLPSKYDIDIDFTDDPFSDLQLDEKKIFDLLKRTNVNKATGPDGINGKLVKFCARGLSKPLVIIFNKIFKSGTIPNKWKLANIVPVVKKGDKSSVTNYRPISLTCLPMKIFEYCIKDLLIAKCGNLIKENQHGFSIEKSCLTQLLPLIDKFSVAMNNKSRVDTIYFDFAKAFDSVNHDLILYKLKNKFGIDGLLLQVLRDYLSNRYQRVVINGFLSGSLSVSSGVPQGSILGPLLFILFIDDICDDISEGTNLELYADDAKIWREILTDKDQHELQLDIDRLHNWSLRNLMIFHPDKCKVMAITNKSLDYPLPFYEFWYHLDDKMLIYVNNEKDLGIFIDHKLSWTNQCEMAIHKATKQFNLLRRTCYFINDSKQRRALYLTLVRSMFEHCSQIWSPQNSTSLILFDKLQKRAVKWILKEQHESYSYHVFLNKQKELDLLPMEYRFLFTDLVLFFRIINNDVKIKLPYYIMRNEPQDIKSVTRRSLPIKDGVDHLQYKCILQPKVKCFQDSYFVRTCKKWNEIPFEIRSLDQIDKFKKLLKDHLWLILGLKPD